MNSKLIRAIAIALALSTSGGSPLLAQEPEFTSWRVPGWSFTPGLTFGGVYDSNVALTSATADTRRTDSDRLVQLEPFGTLEYLSPRTDFSVGYHGFLRRYVDVRELDSFDQQGHLSLRRLVTRRLTFFMRDSYTAAPTTDEVELNGVPFVRSGLRTNTFSSGIETRLTKFTDLSTRYDLTWVDFDTESTFLTGGWVNALRTDLTRRLTERAAVGVEYAYRFADLNDGTRELTFQDAGATARFQLTANTKFTAAAGVSYLNDRLFDDTRTGPYYRAALEHETERATVGASFEKMFVPSFGFGGSSDNQELRAYVRMPVSRNRTYIQASASWRRSDPFIDQELDLDSIWLRTTFGYAATRWLRLEAFHAYTRQDSRLVAGGQVDRQRAGAQIVISQPMRIR